MTPSSSAETTFTRAPSRSSTFCSHHLLSNHVPVLHNISSQRSRIGCITMYYATILCLLSTYTSTSSNPDSYIITSNGGYYQLLSRNHQYCLPVIHLTTLYWNPPRDRTMWGFITQVSYPKRGTACTTALKNIPNNYRLSTSCPKIFNNRAQLLLAFLRVPTTARQSSPTLSCMIYTVLVQATRVRPGAV